MLYQIQRCTGPCVGLIAEGASLQIVSPLVVAAGRLCRILAVGRLGVQLVSRLIGLLVDLGRLVEPVLVGGLAVLFGDVGLQIVLAGRLRIHPAVSIDGIGLWRFLR